jgi:WD40 repeat protein
MKTPFSIAVLWLATLSIAFAAPPNKKSTAVKSPWVKQLLTAMSHNDEVRCILTPDGKRLFKLNPARGELSIIDTQNGLSLADTDLNPEHTPGRHVYSMALKPNGDLLLFVGHTKPEHPTIEAWDMTLNSLKKVTHLKREQDGAWNISFHSNRWLLDPDAEGYMTIGADRIDSDEYYVAEKRVDLTNPYRTTFFPNGNILLSTTLGYGILDRNLDAVLAFSANQPGDNYVPNSVATSPNGKDFATASGDLIDTWSTTSDQPLTHLGHVVGHFRPSALVYTHNGKYLITAGDYPLPGAQKQHEYRLEARDPRTLAVEYVIEREQQFTPAPLEQDIVDIQISRDGKTMLTVDYNGRTTVWKCK